MLSENLIHTILNASITGSTLILIIYTVAIPFSKKILLKKAEEELNLIEKVVNYLSEAGDKDKEKPNIRNLTKEDAEKIHEMTTELKDHRGIPFYLTSGSGYLIFIGYALSALMAISWLNNYQRAFMDAWIFKVFGIATLILLIAGVILIKDVTGSIPEEYNKIKKEIKKSKWGN